MFSQIKGLTFLARIFRPFEHKIKYFFYWKMIQDGENYKHKKWKCRLMINGINFYFLFLYFPPSFSVKKLSNLVFKMAENTSVKSKSWLPLSSSGTFTFYACIFRHLEHKITCFLLKNHSRLDNFFLLKNDSRWRKIQS